MNQAAPSAAFFMVEKLVSQSDELNKAAIYKWSKWIQFTNRSTRVRCLSNQYIYIEPVDRLSTTCSGAPITISVL